MPKKRLVRFKDGRTAMLPVKESRMPANPKVGQVVKVKGKKGCVTEMKYTGKGVTGWKMVSRVCPKRS